MPEQSYDVYITQQRDVNYNAVIDQTARFDGLYGMIWPYNHGDVAGNRLARPLHGLPINVKKEITLNTGMTFVQFNHEGEDVWIPIEGIEPPHLAFDERSASCLAQLSIANHDFPYFNNVPATRKHSHIPVDYIGRSHLTGKIVLVIGTANREDGVEFAHCFYNGSTFWVDHNAISDMGTPLPSIMVGNSLSFPNKVHSRVTPATIRYEDGKSVNAQMRLRVQGNYTEKFARQNFEFTLFTGPECSQEQPVTFGDWAPRARFSLRGDYIDQTHARNAAGYQLWRELLHQEPMYRDRVRDKETLGTIMTRPVIVCFDGVIFGLYTLSTYLNADSLKLDLEAPREILLLALDGYADSKDLAFANPTVRLNNSDFEVMTSQNAGNKDLVEDTNRLVSFIHNSSNLTFRTEAKDYFDPQNLIDYLLFVGALDAFDNSSHNTLVYTYDGGHWLFSLLDLDITFDIDADGKLLSDPQPLLNHIDSPLLKRIWTCFPDVIKSRWQELRQTTLSQDHIIGTYSDKMSAIGNANYLLDQHIWQSPTGVTSSLRNVRNFVQKQLPLCDQIIDQL